MPAVVFGECILNLTFGKPGFACGLRRTADTNPVESSACGNVILNDATIWPHPDTDHAAQIEMRNALGRDQTAPRDIAGVARQFFAKKLRPDRRMDPVGADQNIALGGRTVG